MKKHVIILLCRLLGMSSCGVYTNYKPAASVPDQLYGAEVTTNSLNASLGVMPWQELFTDPHLQALIEQGLQNNTDYLSAQLRVKQAEATLLAAKLAYLPSLALAPQGLASSFDGKATRPTRCLLPFVQLDLFRLHTQAKRQSQACGTEQDYQQAVRTQLIAGIAIHLHLLMLDSNWLLRRARAWKRRYSYPCT